MNRLFKWYLEPNLPTRVRWGWFFMSILLVFLVAFPFMGADRVQTILVIDFLILSLFAVAFNLLMGFGGLISFGQAGFFAIGAYSGGLLLVKFKMPVELCMVSGPVFAGLAALFFGYFAVRLTSLYFSMLTLAFAQIIYTLILKLRWLTDGDMGIQGVDPGAFFEEGPFRYYYFTLTVVVLSCGALFRLIKSPFGLALKSIKENRKRAEFVGLDYRRIQHVAFAVSGMFTGVAGMLYAFHVNTLDASLASFSKSFEPILATLIGGVGIFGGPFIGAFVFKVLEDYATLRWPTYWPMAMGSILVLISLFWWAGFIGMLRDPRWQKWLWVPWLYVIRLWNDLVWYIRELKWKYKQR
jgi:branched-chain amino acid transport system permease protein